MAVTITQKSTGKSWSSASKKRDTDSKTSGFEQTGTAQAAPGYSKTETADGVREQWRSGKVTISRTVKSAATPQATVEKDEEEATKKRGFFARLGDTVTGGAKGALGSNVNALGTLYEAGQGTRDAQNREYLEEYSHGLERAKLDMNAMLQANTEKPGSWSENDLQSQQNIIDDWQRKYDAMAKVVGGQVQQKATQASYELADDIQQASAEDIERAKDGLGSVGTAFVDAGTSFTQSMLDNAVGAVTGTGMLPFVVRAFGGSTQEARQGGADLDEQLLYGGAEAAKEYITEKLFGLVLPQKISGSGGSFDDAVEKGIRNVTERLAKTAGGQKVLGNVLTWLAGGASEGLEEGIGSLIENTLINPYLRDWDPDTRTTQEKFEDGLYDMLVGGISGLFSVNNLRGYQPSNGVGKHSTQNEAAGVGDSTSDTTATPSNELLAQAAEQAGRSEGISGKMADRILTDQDAMAALEQAAGQVVQDGMSKSQQRKAVKNAVAALASQQGSISENTSETIPAAAQTQQTAAQRPAATEQRTVAQQAYDMGRVRKAADSLGENGAKALSASYDGSVRVDDYYAGFANYYEAGISGLDMGKVQSQYAAQLTEAQKFAAYSAGQNDAAASLALEREGVKSATVYGDEAGFIQSEHSTRLSKETIRTFDNLARAAGVKIQMEADTGEGGANGWYANGIIHIAADAKNPGIEVAKHEITHRMQEVAPEAYRKYRDYAVNALSEQDRGSFALVEKYKQRYADQVGQNLTTEQAMDEIAADFTEALVVDPAQFEALAKKDRSVARKVLDAVRDFLHKVKALFKGNKSAQNQASADAFGVSIDTLEEAARLWTEALKATSQQAASLQGKADGATMDAVKLSLKDMSEGERAALLQYKSSESYKINAKLRDGTALTAAEQKMVADLDAALEKLPVHEGTVYRRLSFDMEGQEALDAFLAEHAEGSLVPYKAYTSSSTAIDGYPVSGELTATLVIDSKTGRDMAGIGNNNESEILFARNTRFYVENVETDADGKTAIYMKEVAKHGAGQLHSEERLQKMQQLQASPGKDGKLQKVPGVDTRRGADGRGLPGVRGEGNEKVKFSLKAPVEETRDLLALHNKDEKSILAALELGGLPMPSIAVVKATEGHSQYGPISLVFNKATIDPQADSRNKVYGGDAWTPTSPRLEYEVNPDVQRRFDRMIGELTRDFAGGALYHTSPLGGIVSGETSDDIGKIAEKLSKQESVQAAYLVHLGEAVEPVYREKKFDNLGNELLKRYIDSVGAQELARLAAELETSHKVPDEALETVRGLIVDDWAAKNEQRLNQKPELIDKRKKMQHDRIDDYRAESFILNAWDYYEDGGATAGEIDRSETAVQVTNRLSELSPDGDFGSIERMVQDWVRGEIEGLLGEPGIYNGKDPYTPSGKPRSFSQLHYAYTLENIVKAMKEAQKERGEAAWGATAKTLQSVATPEYRNIQEIKADSGRLGLEEGAEYDAKAQAIDGQIDRIITRIKKGNEAHSSNPFVESDIISEVLLDAAKGKKTVDAIMRAFSKEGYKISSQTAQDIQAAFKAAAEMPTGYFEAKPRRAVGFDEVLAAVIPSDSSEKLRSALAGKGVNVLTYESGNEADRLEKVNSVEGARFSLKGDNTLKENATLRQENDLLRERVDYWKGQTKRTTRVTTDKKAVAKAAGQLIESFGADIAVEDIQGDLQSLYDYLASGYDGKDELTYTEARRRAENIARTLVENAVAVDSDMYEQYSDLRDYLRTTKLVYNKYYHGDIPDFNDFRRRNFGRLNLGTQGTTNIDQVYQEMSSLWPEFFNDQAHSHPSDQLLHIAEVLDDIYDITEYNPFSQDMDQAVTGAANEIMELFFDLPQTRKTFADRQAAKLDAAKAKGRQQVQQVREQRDAKLAALREQNQERVQRAIAKERETRARQLNALKDRYAARDAKGREQRAARELRGKIVRHAKALSQKLLRPSDKQHIPESLRGAVAAMLESINLESQYSISEDGKRTKNGDGTPTKRTEAFRALKEQYAKIASEGGDIVIDPSLLGSDAEGIQGSFDAVIAMKDTKLADMNAQQLATVWQVVKAVEHSVNTAGKVLSKAKYARTADWAQALSLGSGSRRAKTSLTKNHALIDLETPYTYFSHYGEAGKAIYRMLRDAQDQQQLMVDHVAEEVRKIVDPKTVKKLEETTRTFTTERGEELTLSTAQIMELYELTKRKQAHDHLLKGGVVQPEVKSAKIRRGTDSILLTAGDLANITGTLTPEQVKIADGLQGLTTGLLADYGNRASMDAYGYKKFTEKDYWPIKSAKEGLHSNIEKGGNNTRSIKNIGMAKTTMPHASNALDLAGIFATFSNHAADMTDYASWLCTMEDINRLFNYQFRDEEGNLTGKTIKGLLDRVGGPGSQKYWHNLMEDIQNGIRPQNDSALTSFAEKGIGSFKGAAVGANARVVIQQPTAFFRAAAVLDPADMTRGLARGATKGNGWKKALKYSPIAMRKDAGGFDISSPTQMKETLFDGRTGVRKLNDTLSAPAGMADAVTWGRLWNACEWATARDHQGLAKGSEAFYKQTAKLFAEVIDQTQVVDGVLQRSNIMRSSSALAQQATSFMGEPIMSLNLLMRSYDQFRYEQDSSKRGKAIKTLGRAATALVVTNVVNALAQSIVDAMRDDDEDKKYWARFAEAFTGITGDEERFKDYLTAVLAGNLGDNMNLLGNIPYVKDGLSLARGYSVGRSDMEVVSDLVDAAKLFIKSADGEGKKTTAYSIKALLASAAKLFGIPVSNLTRDVWGFVHSIAVSTDNIPLQYEMEKAIYNISNTGNYTRYYDILYRALETGDTEVYEHIYADMVANGIPEDKIRSGMESRMKKAQGVDSVTDLERRFLSPQQTESYERVYKRVTGSAAWGAASEEQREMLEDDLYDLTVGNTDGLKLQEKIDGGAAYGIDETDYLLYRLALHIADQPSESGKLGSYTGEEVEAAIDMLPGLDDEARAYLWAAAGKSEKSNPYK